MTTIQKHKTYRVSGNTFACREDLKRAAGAYDKDTGTWTVKVGGMSDSGTRHILERVQKSGCTVEEV